MSDALVTLIQNFAQFLSQFVTAIFGGLRKGVGDLFFDDGQPTAFAFIALFMIALMLATSLTKWITNWLSGQYSH